MFDRRWGLSIIVLIGTSCSLAMNRHPATRPDDCRTRWPVLDTAGALAVGALTAAFASYDVYATCDDSSPFSGCFKTESARSGVSVLFGSGAAVLAVSAIYGFVQTSSCKSRQEHAEEAVAAVEQIDVLPMSCVAAARLRGEDRFHNAPKTDATIAAERTCARDQASSNQEQWHASQEVRMERIEWDHYKELSQASDVSQAQTRQPPGLENAPPPAERIPAQPEPAPRTTAYHLGSCFFVSPDGIAVTNDHVVAGAQAIIVIDASNVKHDATVLRSSKDRDLAVLDIPSAAHHAALALDSATSISLGQHVFTIGFPLPTELGFDPKFSDGAVAGLRGAGDDSLFQMTVPIQKGNSGGAVVTDDGLVVGVVVAKLDAMSTLREAGQLPENVNFAIKSSAVVPLLRGIRLASPRKAASRGVAVNAVTAAACQVIATE